MVLCLQLCYQTGAHLLRTTFEVKCNDVFEERQMQAVTCRMYSLTILSCRMYHVAFHQSEISAHNVDSAFVQSCRHPLKYKLQCIIATGRKTVQAFIFVWPCILLAIHVSRDFAGVGLSNLHAAAGNQGAQTHSAKQLCGI